MRSEALFEPFDYQEYLVRVKNGEFPFQGGDVPVISPTNSLVNNNAGSSGTAFFTQKETTLLAFGNKVVIGFNDSGSYAGGSNQLTGFARSTDGGATFTDGGTLPNHPDGDAGVPVLARHEATGRIYFSTLQYSGSGIQVFRSDDDGATWAAPSQGAPGKSGVQEKEWMTVDNFAGDGNGNVYLVARDFGPGNGIYFFRSTDSGDTFAPSGGTLIAPEAQGAYVTVGPDHSVYAFWWEPGNLFVRKSTDRGSTFDPPVAVVSGLAGGTNGDLGLTGIRQGTTMPAVFRSNQFPHAAVNPVNGNIYVVYNNRPSNEDKSEDKADIFVVQSTDSGASWSSPLRVNDDATITDQWQPTLAVTPDGANLGIFYYSRQEDPVDNNRFKFYGRIARVSGATPEFMRSFAISDEPSPPEFGRDSVVNPTYMGDYDTAVGTMGAFHVTWSDNRFDLPGGAPCKDPNVFYKRIDLTLHVTTTVPLFSGVVSTPPSTYTVNVSEAVDPATLQASDFTVNGIAASSFSYMSGSSTINFAFDSSPVTAEGQQIMAIAAGAFSSALAGDPVAEFTGPFRYDTQTLAVVATTPAAGGVFTLPSPLTYDVTFNEPVNPDSVQINDLELSGIPGSVVTAAVVLPGNTTVRFTLTAPAEGTLTANIRAGAVTDIFGNVGTAFTAGYITDIDTVPFPTLLAKDPPGSLIYDASATGVIGYPNDADSFTLTIYPGQTITAIVTGLQARVELRDPGAALIAGAAPALQETAPDQPAIIQTAPAATSGTFTITVRGAGGATGGYSLQVILNAAGELEGISAGGTNDTPATAQDLSASFIPLPSSLAPASRGAVLGSNTAEPLVPFQTFDFESGEQGFVIDNVPLPGKEAGLWHLSVGHGAQTGHSQATSFYFGQGEGPEGGGDYNVGETAGAITSAPITLPDNLGVSLSFNYILQKESEENYDVASVQISSDGGATFTTIASSTSRTIPESRVWRNASFSLRPFAGQTVLIRFNFDTLDGTSNDFEGWYVDDVQLSAPVTWNDYYAFSAGDYDAVSAVVENLSGYVNIFLEDETGMVLAAGAGGVTNYSNGINSFPIETGGTYFLRVSGALSSTYTLVVSRNSAFDTEANDTSATAQSLSLTRGAFGLGGESTGPIQSFDDGLFTGYTAFGPALATVTAEAAHDGPFGVQIADRSGWLYRNDAAVAVQRGDTISAWVQAASDPAIGRFYFGFGASEAGTLSLVLGGNTGSLVLQRNPNLEYYEDIGSVPQLWEPNKWYRFEVAWGIDGGITGRLYDSDGTTLLNTVTGSDTTITSGGLAFRGIGLTHFVDSVEKSGMRNDDWYRVTVLGGLLRLETGTPADGAGDFVNTFDPHLELYDSIGQTLLASGVPLEDGRNEAINFSGLPAPVTYLVRLTGEGDTQGEYFLGVGVPVFSGFLPPLHGKKYQAGSVIPVKFSFGADLGLDILAAGSPVSRQVSCSNGAPLGPWEAAESVPGLHYGGNQYIYNWKTLKAWSGTCRVFDLILADGRHFKTKVRFK